MAQRSVLLIIGGGIAAYKSLELIRELSRRGIATLAILTKAGSEFITPLSVASLSGEKCFTDLFDLTDEAEMGHIQLSRSADLVVVAPATADLLGKAANGLANDLASTALMATDKQVLFAPAMNVRMWQHKATQRNVAQLTKDGAHFVGPDDGDMACGEFGPGRMAEPLAISDAIEKLLPGAVKKNANPQSGPLKGKSVLITAGPTHEPIDPVRYIANRSSGKQGYAIAEALQKAGAKVTLVSGPTSLADLDGVTMKRVETAREMLAATQAALPADIAIFCAAVADYRPAKEVRQKIKKEQGGMDAITLAENPDILKTIAGKKKNRPSLVIGFAAETQSVMKHAQEKMMRKGCDWIIANDVSEGTNVMGGDRNTVMFITEHTQSKWPTMTKADVATRLTQEIIQELTGSIK